MKITTRAEHLKSMHFRFPCIISYRASRLASTLFLTKKKMHRVLYTIGRNNTLHDLILISNINNIILNLLASLAHFCFFFMVKQKSSLNCNKNLPDYLISTKNVSSKTLNKEQEIQCMYENK